MHYCVANMPGAVARTSTFALNNATLPFALALADKGWKRRSPRTAPAQRPQRPRRQGDLRSRSRMRTASPGLRRRKCSGSRNEAAAATRARDFGVSMSSHMPASHRMRRNLVAILLSQQNARQSLAIADRAYVLENGRITTQGRSAELLALADIAQKYLGVGQAVGDPHRAAQRMLGNEPKTILSA